MTFLAVSEVRNDRHILSVRDVDTGTVLNSIEISGSDLETDIDLLNKTVTSWGYVREGDWEWYDNKETWVAVTHASAGSTLPDADEFRGMLMRLRQDVRRQYRANSMEGAVRAALSVCEQVSQITGVYEAALKEKVR